MQLKIDDQVSLFLQKECTFDDRDAFLTALRLVLEDPIGETAPWLGRTDQPQVLRFFRFAGYLAFFEYHYTGDTATDFIWVRRCKKAKPNTSR